MWGMMIKTRQVLVQCTVPCHRLPLLNSTGLDQPAPLNDLKLMSAAFFSETNVLLQHSPGNGDRMFPSVITRSSILQNNNSWQLCFARSFRRSTQTLLQTARTEVEGMHFFPLEEQDVQRARAWLASHEVFHFEEGDARGSAEQWRRIGSNIQQPSCWWSCWDRFIMSQSKGLRDKISWRPSVGFATENGLWDPGFLVTCLKSISHISYGVWACSDHKLILCHGPIVRSHTSSHKRGWSSGHPLW